MIAVPELAYASLILITADTALYWGHAAGGAVG
jgi:hypothetical protein